MATRRKGLGSGAAVQAVMRRQTAEVGQEDAPPPPTPPTSIVAALRRPDAATSTAAGVVSLPVSDIAEHPSNPRAGLGDLRPLADSIISLGLLQPILVVPVEEFLSVHPQHQAAIGTREWVVVAGHRRRAAAELAGQDTVPALVRPDLAAAGSAEAAFVVENLHRVDLSPLEEARAYALLADLDLSQRQIATRTGVSQSHISKRLALLRLPQEAQDDLATGDLTIAEALALTAAPAEDQAEVYALAKARHHPVASAITALARQREEARRAEEAHAQAQREDIPVVDPTQTWGAAASAHRLHDEHDVTAAREDGTLHAAVTSHGLAYYSSAPAAASETSAEVSPRQRRAAATARAAACAQLVAKRPGTRQMTSEISTAVLHGLAHTDCLKLAHAWLGERVGPATPTPLEWAHHLSTDETARTWVAWAMSVAAQELRTRSAETWTADHIAHVRRLIDQAGYLPAPWEQDRLDQARTQHPSPTDIPPGADATRPEGSRQ